MVLAGTSTRWGRASLALAALAGLVATSACKRSGAPGGVTLAKEKLHEGPLEVPMPAEGAHRLHVLKDATPVLDRPGPNGQVLGELRAGTELARSEKPYGKFDCEAGYFAVRPRGFVCVGKRPDGTTAASLTADLPAPPAPDLSRPLPYRYAKARAEGVPLYASAPGPAEQAAQEPDLAKVIARANLDKDVLGAAANDVPCDERGVPKGPATLVPGQAGVGADGKRTALSQWTFAADALAFVAAPPSPFLAKGAVVPKGAHAAFAGSIALGARRFGVTPEGALSPVDRYKPALGSTWHGIDLEGKSLPVAFVHKLGVHTWTIQKGKAAKSDDELDRHAILELTGKFRVIDGVRFEQTKDGAHVRAQDLIVVVKRSKLPDVARGGQKWIDVSVANQTLTLYEGNKPVYATLVSTGRDMLKDAATAAATPRGTFRVTKKLFAKTQDGKEANDDQPLPHVPWVLEFSPGAALTGQYWSDAVGEARGFHNVALSPVDARRVFLWSDPPVPEGWNGVTIDDKGPTTIVVVRP